jgi:uncharacterized SAM-binding protein YcdF (DUF218 family)
VKAPKPKPRRAGRFVKACLRLAVWLAAALFVLQIVSAVTGLQTLLHQYLSMRNGYRLEDEPRYMIVLGGGGIPSESGLIRTYYAAVMGRAFSNATVVVALPSDGDPETSSVGRMRDELVMRGLSADSILMEYRGLNTHQQAANIRAMLGPDVVEEPVLLVTSPYHVRRSVLTFRKVGFRNVAGEASVEMGAEADVGGRILLRYSFWQNLESQSFMVRELVAILYYRFRGWI